MNRGELVSDELVLKIVKQNLDKDNKGWILDGYPRNLSQANSLNEVLIEINQPLELVFYLDIPEEVLIKRLLLRGRKDDTEETIRTRVDIYKKTTFDGSFDFPLKGSGDKYGESVSINILLRGIDLNVSLRSLDFLNVIMPLAEKNASKSRSLSANFFVPVKQCIKIFNLSFFEYFDKIS